MTEQSAAIDLEAAKEGLNLKSGCIFDRAYAPAYWLAYDDFALSGQRQDAGRSIVTGSGR
jgi:hypothetical protein